MRFSRSPSSSSSSSGSPATGVFLSTRYLSPLLILLTCLVALQAKSFFRKEVDTSKHRGVAVAQYQQPATIATTLSATTYRESKPVLRNPKDQDVCRFYLAESAVAPNSGMGMFTATGLLKDEMIGFPDICIFVSDSPKKWTHLRSHSWGWGQFFGQYEGTDSRAACEGYASIFNTMPSTHLNTKIHSLVQPTTAGVRRDQDPAAGSFSHNYGITSKALDVIPTGSELTVNYGNWERFDDKAEYVRPSRTPEWLAENGWCIDHMEIQQSTIPGAGRGAFVKRNLLAGTMVAPVPLQAFQDRTVFQTTNPEQLYVNYCYQPAGSKIMFYGYGPGVNLINHSLQQPNVRLQWSTNYLHKVELLDMEYKEFWDSVTPGALVMEVIALRDLVAGEELLMDYGPEWESAWNDHVKSWTPEAGADSYVYPEEMDDTAALRTVKEQEENPYPDNLITMCMTGDKKRKYKNHQEWSETTHSWSHAMAFCHILDRKMGPDGQDEYTVSLVFAKKNTPLEPKDYVYDKSVPIKDLYVDIKVPRRAIRWIEKPYLDDEHLANAFRHPVGLPDDLIPEAWKAPPPSWIKPNQS